MNKCDPFYCEGLTRGHIFGVALFGVGDWQEAGWYGSWGQGVRDVWGGGGVSMCLTRGHIFWCRTFWGGELALRRVVWVLGMVGVEGVSRCV